MGVGLELFNWGFFAITVRIIDMSRKKKKGCVLLESSFLSNFYCVSIPVREAFLTRIDPSTRTQVRRLAVGHYLMFSVFPS